MILCDVCDKPAVFKCGGCNTARCEHCAKNHYADKKYDYGCAGFGFYRVNIEVGSQKGEKS